MRPPAEMACWSPSPATRRELATTLAVALLCLVAGAVGVLLWLHAGAQVST